MLVDYLAVTLFVLSVADTIRSRRFLPAFFVLCYMLPFLPLFAAPFGMDVTFWTGDRFVYPHDSAEVARMQQIWASSSLGVILGLVASRVRISRSPNVGFQKSEIPHHLARCLVLGWDRAMWIFLTTAALVLQRFISVGDTLAESFPGYELAVCLLLLLCWTLAFHSTTKAYYLVAACLTAAYVWSQVRTGDRDFFLILIALMLRLAAFRSSAGGVIAVGIAGLVLMLSGAVISMVRMDVELSAEGLFEFLAFNSWNATILPVLLMVENEASNGALLYGKTYIDLILSVPPSPFFAYLGVEKPIQSDNPAFWFFVDGLGGMHIVGVALRNFALTGVCVQSLLFVLTLARLERRLHVARSPWGTYFYLCVAGALMHTVWYSLMSMLNALVLFLAFYAIFSIRLSIPGYMRGSDPRLPGRLE